MTARQFYDWQTAGGGGDVSLLVNQDQRRRPSKRQKDLLDIMRVTEAHPRLRKLLPETIAKKIQE